MPSNVALDTGRVPSAGAGMVAGTPRGPRGAFEVAMETEEKLKMERRRIAKEGSVAPGVGCVWVAWGEGRVGETITNTSHAHKSNPVYGGHD